MNWFFYNLVFPVVFLLLLPKFLIRMMRRGGYARHFEQRFGLYGQGVSNRLAEGRRIWIHAVSVGELQVALQWIDAARRDAPDRLFIVSTNTSTGHALAQQRLDDRDVLIYFPIDLPCIMRRVLRTLNPERIVLVEGEFWPNLIRLAHRRGIPVSLINGRVSDSSYRGYRLLRPLMRDVLGWIDPVCVQGRADAERILALGARPETVQVTGTAKYDLPLPGPEAGSVARAALRARGVPDHALVLLGGSTWPGEEEALCRVFQALKGRFSSLVLVLVPRHAERRSDVLNAVTRLGITAVLHSEPPAPAPRTPEALIVDTTGDLMEFYAVADVVFVGKSLCNRGGQNPIEPALLAKAIVTGPNMQNFSAVMDDFCAADAVRRVSDEAELLRVVEILLDDSVERARLGDAARQVVHSRRGAVAKMVRAVLQSPA